MTKINRLAEIEIDDHAFVTYYKDENGVPRIIWQDSHYGSYYDFDFEEMEEALDAQRTVQYRRHSLNGNRGRKV